MSDSPTHKRNTTGLRPPWTGSGNPGGRPRKGFKGVSKMIMRETHDGLELVAWALSIWRDESAPANERWKAYEWLSMYGLGKPVATVELHVDAPEPARDLSALSDEQLAVIDAVFTEAGAPLQLPSGEGEVE